MLLCLLDDVSPQLRGDGRLGASSGLARWVSFILDDRARDSGRLADDEFAGYPMAKNLRAKIPATDTLVIYDRNTDATKRFAEEVGIAAPSAGAPEKGTGIEVAGGPREVAEKSVRHPPPTSVSYPVHMMSMFYP